LSDDDIIEATTSEQRSTLAIVLALNVGLAIALAIGGTVADSSGLIANALDNASDAAVYALSLFAIGRSMGWKRAAATASGILLVIFSLGVLGDTARRYLTGSEPIGAAMMGLAVVAAIINLACVRLLSRLRNSDVNVDAARTFSFNDFIANGGILVAGGLVLWTGERWPDLLVGLAVSVVAMKGGVEILLSARRARADPS
jgi:Co/Zn/Cd efflux system component